MYEPVDGTIISRDIVFDENVGIGTRRNKQVLKNLKYSREIPGIAENATEEQDRVDGYANEGIHEEGNISQKSNDKSGEPTRRIRRPPKYVNDYDVLSWKIEKKSSAA